MGELSMANQSFGTVPILRERPAANTWERAKNATSSAGLHGFERSGDAIRTDEAREAFIHATKESGYLVADVVALAAGQHGQCGRPSRFGYKRSLI